MTTTVPLPRPRCLAGPLALVLALLVPGCGSVAHITTLRDLQDDFNRAASEENRASAQAALLAPVGQRPPNDALDAPPGRGPLAHVDLRQADDLHRRYHDVHAGTSAVIARFASELAADGLAPNALALRALARWRATFYGHVVGVLGGGIAGAPGPMTDVAETARSALRAIDALRTGAERPLVHPRDTFLLTALANGSLIRHDIAYLQALRGFADGTMSRSSRDPALPIIEDMARAEEALAATPLPSAHLDPYVAWSRILMLHAADSLINALEIDPDSPPWSAALATTVRRMRQAHADARTPGTPLAQALGLAGLTLTDFFPEPGGDG